MALLDRFKKKEEEKKAKPAVSKKIEKKAGGSAWRFLAAPHVTEKATNLEEHNTYVFKVYREANKSEIKKAVHEVYGVDVKNVNIVNVHPKKRRVGKKGEGWRKGYKKAFVSLEKGQKIEILSR